MHNGAPVYIKYTEKMITVKKIKYTIVEERFLFLNDDGKWTVNNVKNDRGVFRGISKLIYQFNNFGTSFGWLLRGHTAKCA